MIPDFSSKEWQEFVRFARGFYGEVLQMAIDIAGQENANTIQILLRQLSPDLLTLWKYYAD